MAPEGKEPFTRQPLWWAAAAFLGVVVLALLVIRPWETQPSTPDPSPSLSVTPSSTPTASPSVTEPSPSATVSSQPTPTVPRTPGTTSPPTRPTSIGAYCAAYAAILEKAPDEEPQGDDTAVDLTALSRTYADLIRKYEAAQAQAPAGLADEYRTVVQYLKDVKATVDSGDMNAIRAQFRLLRDLNDTMETIATESKALCP